MKKRVIYTILSILFIIFIIIVIKNSINSLKQNYEIEQIEIDNYLILEQNSKYGVIDRNANQIIKPIYEKIVIPNPQKDVFICYDENENAIVLNKDGTQILEKYEKISEIPLRNIDSKYIYEKSTLIYSKNGKYGIVDTDGKKITSAIYTSIESLPNKEGELLVNQNNKYGVINIKGYKIIPCAYYDVQMDEYYLSDEEYKYAGYIVRNKTDDGFRFGYYNYKGEKLCDTLYNNVERFLTDNKDEIYLKLSSAGQYGIMRNKKMLIPISYQSIDYDLNVNMFIIQLSGKFGVIDLNGKEVLENKFSQIKTSKDYFYVSGDSNVYVYDLKGNLTDKDNSYIIEKTPNENIDIKINQQNDFRYRLVDSSGNEVSDGYSYISYLAANNFIASKGENLGVINDNNEEVLEFNNVKIQKIINTNLIEIQKENSDTIDIYDSNFNLIAKNIEQNYVILDGYLYLNQDDKQKIIIDIKESRPVTYKQINPNCNLYSYYENGQFGFVDGDGNVVIDAIYDDITEVNEFGYASIKKDGKWGCVNSSGNVIVEPTFELNFNNVTFLGRYYKANYSTGDIVFTDRVIEY